MIVFENGETSAICEFVERCVAEFLNEPCDDWWPTISHDPSMDCNIFEADNEGARFAVYPVAESEDETQTHTDTSVIIANGSVRWTV